MFLKDFSKENKKSAYLYVAGRSSIRRAGQQKVETFSKENQKTADYSVQQLTPQNKKAMIEKNYTTKTFVLTTGGYAGYWAKGPTIGDAARMLNRQGAGFKELVVLRIVFNDEGCYVNEMGGVSYGGSEAPEAWCLPAFVCGTLGALVKANPKRN